MPSDLPPLPRTLVVAPPPELIPKDLAEALVAIGKLQVTCTTQQAEIIELRRVSDDHDKVISTANGWKQALLWLGGVTVAATTIIYNLLHSKPGS